MYAATTRGIKVEVQPKFLEGQSQPDEGYYVWAYTIRIENTGKETVQLVNRHWKITDGRGQVEEVRGAGVVGKQPVLQPGESFDYTSGCPLRTPSGFMVGTYEMRGENGETFLIDIPAFSLDSPFDAGTVN